MAEKAIWSDKEEHEFCPDEFEEDSLEHIIKLLPPVVSHAVAEIPLEYFSMTTAELQQKIEADGQQLTTHDQRLRLSVWAEYHKASGQGRPISMPNIYRGICSKQYFYAKVLPCRAKLAFIFNPPVDYTQAMEECLMYGVERMREILSLPLRNKEGLLDYRLMNVIMKVVQVTDLRVKGAVIQRIEQRNVNANFNMTAEGKDVKPPQTVEELNAQLAELEARTKAMDKSPLRLEDNSVTILEAVGAPSMEEVLVSAEEILGDRREQGSVRATTSTSKA